MLLLHTDDNLLLGFTPAACRYCGVCHSDLHSSAGHLKKIFPPPEYPLVPGHEMVGVVTAIGPDVDKFKVGDHVRRGSGWLRRRTSVWSGVWVWGTAWAEPSPVACKSALRDVLMFDSSFFFFLGGLGWRTHGSGSGGLDWGLEGDGMAGRRVGPERPAFGNSFPPTHTQPPRPHSKVPLQQFTTRLPHAHTWDHPLPTLRSGWGWLHGGQLLGV